MKKSFILAIKLLIICAVAAAALAYVNQVTAPIIAEREAEATKKAYKAVYPEAEDFTPVEDKSLLDKHTLEIAEAKVGGKTDGYVFKIASPQGYDGPITFVIGTKVDGTVTGFEVLKHTETSGFGAKIMQPWYTDGFKGVVLDGPVVASGKGGQAHEIPAIAGATYTTKAMEAGVNIIVEKLAALTGRTVDMNAKPEASAPAPAEKADANEETMLTMVSGAEKLEQATPSGDSVKAVYKALKGDEVVGYVFHVVTPKGYSAPIEFLISTDAKGDVESYKIVNHDETPGFGGTVEDKEYADKILGHGIGAVPFEISGATISTKALETAFNDVKETFKAVSGMDAPTTVPDKKAEESSEAKAETSSEEKVEKAAEKIDVMILEMLVGAKEVQPITPSGDCVKEAYKAVDGDKVIGYGFYVVSPRGFDSEIEFLVACDPEGKIVAFNVLKQHETPGFGAEVAEESYAKELAGKPVDKAPVAISGATVTSDALTKAFEDVAATFNAAK